MSRSALKLVRVAANAVDRGRRAGNRDPLLSREEAADYLHVQLGTVKKWLGLGRIEYVKVGGLTRIRISALEAFLQRRTQPADPQAEQLD